MSIIVPNPTRKRLLMIIDMQPGFIQPGHEHVISNTIKLIKEGEYDMVIVTEFRAVRGTLWDQQMQWTFPHTPTVKEIVEALDPKKTITVIKNTRSVFTMKPYLAADLRMQDIEEIHLVGYDINDCVLTSANHSFDLGFYSYVIEEACESSESPELREAALAILRENEMTNHSELISDKKVI